MSQQGIHLFIDNSNVLLEGRRFSQARRSGRDSLGKDFDASYEIDWGKFLYLLRRSDARPLAQVPILYGSRPPPDDSVWERIRNENIDTKVFDRNIRNKEKGVDMEMGMDVVERLALAAGTGTIVIAAGDADYVPVIARVKKKGWRAEVWFWSNAATTIKTACDEFIALDSALDYLRLKGGVAFPPSL